MTTPPSTVYAPVAVETLPNGYSEQGEPDAERAPYFARIFHAGMDEGYSRIPKKRRAHAIAVHVTLARHAGKEHTCFPSIERLAKLTGLARATVVDALKELKRAGLIAVERTGRKSVYTLTVPGPRSSRDELVKATRRTSEVRPVNSKKKQKEETTKNSRRDAHASSFLDILKNPFGYFCAELKRAGMQPWPDDRERTSKQFKDFVNHYAPTEEELKT